MAVNRVRSDEPLEGEVVYPSRIPYGRTVNTPLPQQPKAEAGRSGFLGLRQNPIDADSERRQRKLHHIAMEINYGERLALALDVNGINDTVTAVGKVEDRVYAEAPQSLAGRVATDLASDMAARSRLHHSQYMEAYDVLMLSIIHERR